MLVLLMISEFELFLFFLPECFGCDHPSVGLMFMYNLLAVRLGTMGDLNFPVSFSALLNIFSSVVEFGLLLTSGQSAYCECKMRCEEHMQDRAQKFEI